MSQHPSVRDPGGVLTILYVPLLIYTVSDNGTNYLHLSLRILSYITDALPLNVQSCATGSGEQGKFDWFLLFLIRRLVACAEVVTTVTRQDQSEGDWVTHSLHWVLYSLHPHLREIYSRKFAWGQVKLEPVKNYIAMHVNSLYKPHGHSIYLYYILHKSINHTIWRQLAEFHDNTRPDYRNGFGSDWLVNVPR